MNTGRSTFGHGNSHTTSTMKTKTNPRNSQRGFAIIFVIIGAAAILMLALALYLKLRDPNPPANPDWDAAMRDEYLRDWLMVQPPPAPIRATPEPAGWQPVWNSISE